MTFLIITADHGNDPTYTGTDHTCERVRFLAYSKAFKESGDRRRPTPSRSSSKTIADDFGVKMPDGTIGYSIPGSAEIKYLRRNH